MQSLSFVTCLPVRLNSKAAKILSIFRDDIQLSRLNTFQIRLLLQCSADTAV